MTEIKIRNIDDDAIARIDSMAAKVGVSRNMYLKRQIELLSESPALLEKDDRYEKIAELMLAEIKRCEDFLKKNEEVLSSLLAALES